MNKQIHKLIDQATLSCMEVDPAHSVPAPNLRFNQIFAMLIVRECMDIAREVGNISEPDDWALDRCFEIEQKIQDRFGVEEGEY